MFTHVVPAIVSSEVQTETIKNGRWYVTPNGKYPSVTTVLGKKPKPAIENWKNMLGPVKAKKETDRCADRGTAVHTMCEHYLNNVAQETLTKGQTRDNIRLFNQIKLGLNKRVNNIYVQEIALWSDTLKLAGRTDVIAEYDGVLSVVDFKTSNNLKEEHMVEDYFLQSTAYAIMFNEMFGIHIEDIVIVITTEKGLMPQIYKRKIFDYIDPLLQRIDDFYNEIP